MSQKVSHSVLTAGTNCCHQRHLFFVKWPNTQAIWKNCMLCIKNHLHIALKKIFQAHIAASQYSYNVSYLVHSAPSSSSSLSLPSLSLLLSPSSYYCFRVRRGDRNISVVTLRGHSFSWISPFTHSMGIFIFECSSFLSYQHPFSSF